MSFKLVAWAMEQTTGSPTKKWVLVALANVANHHTGQCHPSIEYLARETELGESTIRRLLKELADEDKLITRTRRRRGDGSLGVYEFGFPESARARTPPLGVSADPPLGVSAQEPGEDLEPGGVHPSGSASPHPTDELARLPRKVDGKAVTVIEARQALDILERWNEATKQRLTAKTYLAKIVMRVREHPELNVGDHETVIRAALRDPWWKGAPSPSVVYGNDAIFERSLAAVDAPTDIEAFYEQAKRAEELVRRRRRAHAE